MLTRSLAMLAGVSFFAGTNLYAVTLALGIALRWEWITLPADLAGLAVLGRGGLLVASGILFAIGFLVEKIPYLDNVWNAVHLGVRPAVVLALAWHTLEGHPSTVRITATLICGALALAAAWGKFGAHVMYGALASAEQWPLWVNLSLVEDLLALGGLALALYLPNVGLGLAVVFLVLTVKNGWRIRDAIAILRARARFAREQGV